MNNIFMMEIQHIATMPAVQELNLSLFQWLAAGAAPNPQILWFAALVAQGSSWLCVLLMGWVAWRHPTQRSYVLAALVAAAAASMLAHGVAGAINLPRPFIAGLSPAYIDHGARGSLPSTHATVMFSVALIFCLRPATRAIGLAIFFIAILTGWARIYVGVHYPLDIVAGFALAVLIAAVFRALVWLKDRFVVPMIARDDAKSTGRADIAAEQPAAAPLAPKSDGHVAL